MKSNKILTIFMAALLIAGAAFYLSSQQKEQVTDQERGQVYLSGLSQQINDVGKIILRDASQTTELVLSENVWQLVNKSNYPADFAKVKKLLLNLVDLKTIESKTAKAENYGRLGVQGVDNPGDEPSKEIKLFDKSANPLISLIVGKSKPGAESGKSAIYVRKAHEDQTWLVAGDLQMPFNVNDWMDKTLLKLSSDRVQSVFIKRDDGKTLAISKAAKDDKHFALDNIPTGRELNSENAADPIAAALQNLTFLDVISRADFNVNEKTVTTAVYKTFDGLEITAKHQEQDKKHYLWLESSFSSAEDNIKSESDALNLRFKPWVFEISSFTAGQLRKSVEDLLKKKEGEK